MLLFLIEALSIWKSCLGARYPGFHVSIVVVAGEEDTISAIWELAAKNLVLNSSHDVNPTANTQVPTNFLWLGMHYLCDRDFF